MTFSFAAVEVGNHLIWNVSGLFLHGDNKLIISGSLSMLCTFANGSGIGLRRQQDIFSPSSLNTVGSSVSHVSSGDFEILIGTIGDYNFRPWSRVSLIVICFLASSPCPDANCIRDGLMAALDLATLISTALPDLNGAFAFAFLSSVCYLYTGIRTKGFAFFIRYITPTIALLPISFLEDITKPLSMGFRIFGNSLADDIITGILGTLIPIFVPLAPMGGGQATSLIQAWVYTSLAITYLTESIE